MGGKAREEGGSGVQLGFGILDTGRRIGFLNIRVCFLFFSFFKKGLGDLKNIVRIAFADFYRRSGRSLRIGLGRELGESERYLNQKFGATSD